MNTHNNTGRLRPRTALFGFTTLILMFVLMFAVNAFATGPLEKVIYNFTSHSDGWGPSAGLVADSAGNLYGTTIIGGAFNSGEVFELSPPASGGKAWTKSLLYSFRGGGNDGSNPSETLIFDKLGNLYGNTMGGGGSYGYGTVFELSPPATVGGTWTETVLFIFPGDCCSGSNLGAHPIGKLVFDGAGNLYGTTSRGGTNTGVCDCGTVFELTPPAAGQTAWTQTMLYSFGLVPGDGITPGRGLVIHGGALYGTTQTLEQGFCCGAVFQLVRTSSGWKENVLYSGNFEGGEIPVGGLIVDAAGNLYGTFLAGIDYAGGVYELSPPAVQGDPWQENTLYIFSRGKDGANPEASLILDKAGNLYGTAVNAGLRNKATNNNGTVFELSPPAVSGGAWTETTLHEFGGPIYNDGSEPLSELIVVKGKFYGTTYVGGTSDLGTVFSLTP